MLQVQPTPNANAVKIVTATPLLPSGTLVVTTPADAKDHPLAAELLAVAGVQDLFFTPMFVTVSKVPSATWDDVLPAVEAVLRRHLE